MILSDLPEDILGKINTFVEILEVKDKYMNKWIGKARRSRIYHFHLFKKMYYDDDDEN